MSKEQYRTLYRSGRSRKPVLRESIGSILATPFLKALKEMK